MRPRIYPKNYGRRKLVPAHVDLGLAVLCAVADVLCAVADVGETFTHRQIAESCGVTESAIRKIEQTAKKKLANKLRYQSQHQYLREELQR